MAVDKQRGFNDAAHIGEVKEEESDDFIIIDVEKTSNNTTPKQPTQKSKETSKTSESSSVDSGLDLEDYVEVTYDDVDQEVSKCLIINLLIIT